MKDTTKKAARKRRETMTVADLEDEETIGRERAAQRRKERAAQPEPTDTTSDEWRYWKIAKLRVDFESGNSEAYARAHDEFRALLTGLYNDENFWHVSNALALLPGLIVARQEIEKTERAEHEVSESTPHVNDFRIDHAFQPSTYEDARRIANGATLQRKEWDDQELGDLLALMFCLTYCDSGHREGILYEVMQAFMSTMDVAHKAVQRFAFGRYQAARTHWHQDQGGAE